MRLFIYDSIISHWVYSVLWYNADETLLLDGAFVFIVQLSNVERMLSFLYSPDTGRSGKKGHCLTLVRSKEAPLFTEIQK